MVTESPTLFRFGIGLCLHGRYPDSLPHRALLEIARRADQSAVDGLFLEDHLQLPPDEIEATGGLPGRDEPIETWTTLAALATITTRVKLGSAVSPILLRNPVLLAKQAANVDALSGHRLILGLGAGWQRAEFERVGIPFPGPHERIDRLAETVEIVRQLWSHPYVSHEGQHYRISRASLGPHLEEIPPIWLGGRSHRLLRLAARAAEGWITTSNPDPVALEAQIAFFRAALPPHRSPADCPIVVPLATTLVGSTSRWRQPSTSFLGRIMSQSAPEFGLVGSSQRALERLQRYADLGVRSFIFELRPPETAMDSLEILRREVLPAFMDM